MILPQFNDNDSFLPEEDVSAAVRGLKRKKLREIRTILDILVDFDQNYLSGIAQAFSSFPKDSLAHGVAVKYFEHQKRKRLFNSHTFNIDGIIIDSQNVSYGPNYLIKYCTEDEWSSISQKYRDKIGGLTYYFLNNCPLICFPSSYPIPDAHLRHEIRHARDHYILAKQSPKDTVIACEILGYVAGEKQTQEGRKRLIKEKIGPHDISEEDRIFIASIFDAIDRLDVVNLDLLSITPLRKWPKLLSSRLMGRIIQGLKSNMKLKIPEVIRSVQEWSQKSGLNPGDMPTEAFIFENTMIWGDIWRLPNIKTLTFLSPDIQGDISKILKKMKKLKTVKLKRQVYNNISKAFLEKTFISFIILDE